MRATGHHSYDESYNRWLYRRKAQVLRRELARLHPARALDLGTGNGFVLALLPPTVRAVAAVDVSADAVERLRRDQPGVDARRVDLTVATLPWPAASQDIVTAVDLVYHLLDDQALSRLLREVARVLAPGGTFVFTDRLLEAPQRPNSHVHFRSRAQWDRLAAEAGLRTRRVVPFVRWLSRPRELRGWQHLPNGVRGAVEYGMEQAWPGGQTHLRLAVLTPTEPCGRAGAGRQE